MAPSRLRGTICRLGQLTTKYSSMAGLNTGIFSSATLMFGSKVEGYRQLNTKLLLKVFAAFK